MEKGTQASRQTNGTRGLKIRLDITMSTRLNSFILPDHIIEKMRENIETSRKKKIETGFSLCRKKDVMVLTQGTVCEGSKCEIFPRTQKCLTKDEVFQGFYHTHPTEKARPSFGDIINMYRQGLGCIGSVKDNQINCYIRKNLFDKEVFSDLSTEYYDSRITRLIAKNEYEKRLTEITNKLFSKVEIK